jgi:exosortase
MTLTTRSVLFAIYCLGVGLASWSSLAALYEHSQADNTASHIVLIPFISLGLVFLRRDVIFSRPRTSRFGAGVIAIGLAWSTLTRLSVEPSTAQLSLLIAPIVVLWIGGFILFYGLESARAAAFPLLFLAFMVPFPPAMLQAASDFLKDGSTEVVALLFGLTGTPHVREGYVFALPFLAIEVADACSGIRSSIGLLITSLLAGYMFLRTPWKRAVLVFVVVPITIFKNAVRIVTLSLLTIHVDRTYITGQLHHEGGIVFFLISLALMTPVLFWLIRSERSLSRTPTGPTLQTLTPGVSSPSSLR